MSDYRQEFTNAVKDKASAVRFRTWGLTIGILVAIILYILINVGLEQRIKPIDFTFLVIIQIVLHYAFFPDGANSGMRDTTFIANRKAYNEKATKVNQECMYGDLREYCDWEYEERKKMWVREECNLIGITDAELTLLKTKSPKEIKNLKTWEIKNEKGSKLLFFTKSKRKHLYKLLFKENPVQRNSPEFIISAVKHDPTKAITDDSKTYDRKSHLAKWLIAIFWGGFLAYLGWSLKDGISFADIVRLAMYIGSMITTSVMSFSSGEKSIKVHKSNFYISLSNYLDSFFEWQKRTKQS